MGSESPILPSELARRVERVAVPVGKTRTAMEARVLREQRFISHWLKRSGLDSHARERVKQHYLQRVNEQLGGFRMTGTDLYGGSATWRRAPAARYLRRIRFSWAGEVFRRCARLVHHLRVVLYSITARP